MSMNSSSTSNTVQLPTTFTSATLKAIQNEIQSDQQWIAKKRHQLQAWHGLFHHWSEEALNNPSFPSPFSNAWRTLNLPHLLRSHLAYPLSSTPLPFFSPESNPELCNTDPLSIADYPVSTTTTSTSHRVENEIDDEDEDDDDDNEKKEGFSSIFIALPKHLSTASKVNVGIKKKGIPHAFLSPLPSALPPQLEFIPSTLVFDNFVPNQIYMAKVKVKNKLPQLLHLDLDASRSTFFQYEEFHLYSSSSQYKLAMGMVAAFEVYFRPTDAYHLEASLVFRVHHHVYPYLIRCVNPPPRLLVHDVYWDPPEFPCAHDVCVVLKNVGGPGEFTVPHRCSFRLPPHHAHPLRVAASEGVVEVHARNGRVHAIPFALPPARPDVMLALPQWVCSDPQTPLVSQARNHSPLRFTYTWRVDPPYFMMWPAHGRCLPHAAVAFTCSVVAPAGAARCQATASLVSEGQTLAQLPLHYQPPVRQLSVFPDLLAVVGHVHEKNVVSFYVYSTYASSELAVTVSPVVDASFFTWQLEGPSTLTAHTVHEFRLACCSFWPMELTHAFLHLSTSFHTLPIPFQLTLLGHGITLTTERAWPMLLDTSTRFSVYLENPRTVAADYEVRFPAIPGFQVYCLHSRGTLPAHATRALDVMVLGSVSGTSSLLLACCSWCEGVAWQQTVVCDWCCYEAQLHASLPEVECPLLVPTAFTLTLTNPVPMPLRFHVCPIPNVQWQASWGWVPPLSTVELGGKVCCEEVGEALVFLPCVRATLRCHVRPLQFTLQPPPVLPTLSLGHPTTVSVTVVNPYPARFRCDWTLAVASSLAHVACLPPAGSMQVATFEPGQAVTLGVSLTATALVPVSLRLQVGAPVVQTFSLGPWHVTYVCPVEIRLNTPHQLHLRNRSAAACRLHLTFWPSGVPFDVTVPSDATRVVRPSAHAKYLVFQVEGALYPPPWSSLQSDLEILEWIQKYPSHGIVIAREAEG